MSHLSFTSKVVACCVGAVAVWAIVIVVTLHHTPPLKPVHDHIVGLPHVLHVGQQYSYFVAGGVPLSGHLRRIHNSGSLLVTQNLIVPNYATPHTCLHLFILELRRVIARAHWCGAVEAALSTTSPPTPSPLVVVKRHHRHHHRHHHRRRRHHHKH